MTTMIAFTVQGAAFFPASTGGRVTVTVRSDRSGNLILRKCLMLLAEGAPLPEGLVSAKGTSLEGTASLGVGDNRSETLVADREELPSPPAQFLEIGVAGFIDLFATAAEVAAVHGTALSLFLADQAAGCASGSGAQQLRQPPLHNFSAGAVPEAEEHSLEGLMPTRTEAWQCDGASNEEVRRRSCLS